MKLYNMEESLPGRIYMPKLEMVSEVFARTQLVVPMSSLDFFRGFFLGCFELQCHKMLNQL